MTRLDLHLGAPIHCRDGEGGKLAYVVIAADGRHVTEVIVERGLPLISKEARVIPILLVENMLEGTVWLSIRCEQLADYPEYKETTIETTDPAVRGGGYAGSSSSTATIRQRWRQGVGLDRILLDRQIEVKTVHQSVGHVDHLLVNAENKTITHVVMRRGLLRTERPVVPIGMIESIGEDQLLLATSSDEVDEFPRYTA